MKQQPKHPESFKAFLSFLFALLWTELRMFFARINVKGNIQIDIPDVKRLPAKGGYSTTGTKSGRISSTKANISNLPRSLNDKPTT